MNKQQAITLLGGTITAASEAIGVTYNAVRKWPDELPQRVADRVQAALWRKANGAQLAPPAPPAPAAKPADKPARAPRKRRRETATATTGR